MNDATNGSAGCATSSAGLPVCRSSPFDEHADVAGERRGVLEVVRDEQRRDLEPGEQLLQLGAHVGLRVGVERRRAARRAAGSRDRGRARGRARRAAARRRRGLRGARARGARSRSGRGTRRRRGGARTRRSGARSGAGRARSPGRRARPAGPPAAAKMPAAASNQISSPQRIEPAAGSTSPAIAFRTVLLPAPDGPTSATVESTARLRPSSKDRRGTVTCSRVTVAMRVRF